MYDGVTRVKINKPQDKIVSCTQKPQTFGLHHIFAVFKINKPQSNIIDKVGDWYYWNVIVGLGSQQPIWHVVHDKRYRLIKF